MGLISHALMHISLMRSMTHMQVLRTVFTLCDSVQQFQQSCSVDQIIALLQQIPQMLLEAFDCVKP